MTTDNREEIKCNMHIVLKPHSWIPFLKKREYLIYGKRYTRRFFEGAEWALNTKKSIIERKVNDSINHNDFNEGAKYILKLLAINLDWL